MFSMRLKTFRIWISKFCNSQCMWAELPLSGQQHSRKAISHSLLRPAVAQKMSQLLSEGGFFMFSKKKRIQVKQICVLISKSFVYLACEILSHFRFRSSAGDLPCILFSVQWTKEGYREVVVGRSSSKTFPSYISSASCQYQHQVSAS